MTEPARTVDVVVVGGGPVGLVLALLLDRLGVECIVLERARDHYPLPRAVHLDDRALQILEWAGVDGFGTRPVDGMALVDAGLRPFVTFDRRQPRFGRPASVLMHQPSLEAALRSAAGPLLRTGVEVVEVVDARTDSERATVVAADGTRVAARWVVGCDGTAGVVRRATGIGVVDRGFRQRWLVVDLLVDGPDRHPPQVLQICDPSRPATSVPVGNGRHRFEVRVRDDETDEAIVADAGVIVAPWAHALGLDVQSVERAAVYGFAGRLASTYRAGPVLLAGDAAHEMPPFLGQGLCTGLADALDLAWKLASVVDGRANDQLLDSYELERRPMAARAIALTALVGRLVSDVRPVRAAVRNRVVAATERLLPVGRLGQLREPPLPKSSLVRRRGIGLPGAPEPQSGRPVDGTRVTFGRWTLVGRGVDPYDGLTPSLRAWWEGIGALAVREPADGASLDVLVVRPDGVLMARLPAADGEHASALAGLAVRLSGAGFRALGG